MSETRLVSDATVADIQNRATVRWYDPFRNALRMVRRDWFVVATALGLPLTLQSQAVAEVARSPWSLMCLAPVAVGVTAWAIRIRRDSSEKTEEGRETRGMWRIGEAVVITAVVTSTMMLNSLANEGSIEGALIKGAGVVVAASLGYLSHRGLMSIERKRRGEIAKRVLEDLTKVRGVQSEARRRKRVAKHREDGVNAVRDQLVIELTESGLIVSTAVYDRIEKELADVAAELEANDPKRTQRQLEKVVKRVIGDQTKNFAGDLETAAKAKMLLTTKEGKTIVDGDLVNSILTPDPKVAELLAKNAEKKRWTTAKK